jgi:hypothetical protein
MAVDPIQTESLAQYYAEQVKARDVLSDKQQAVNTSSDSAEAPTNGVSLERRITNELQQAQTEERLYQQKFERPTQVTASQDSAEARSSSQETEDGSGIYNSDNIEGLQNRVDLYQQGIDDELATDVAELNPVPSGEKDWTRSVQSDDVQSESQALAKSAVEAQEEARSRVLSTEADQVARVQQEEAQQASLSADKNIQEQANQRFVQMF